MDEEKKYGTLNCNVSNTNESQEGSHTCIVGIMEALMELQTRDAVIIEANLDIRFLDPGLECSTETKRSNVDGTEIIVDKVSLERLRRFDEISDDATRAAFKLLMKYEYKILDEDEYKVFVSEFMDQYRKIDIMPQFEEDDTFDPAEFVDDMNNCLIALTNSHYVIRALHHRRRQLVFNEKAVIN